MIWGSGQQTAHTGHAVNQLPINTDGRTATEAAPVRRVHAPREPERPATWLVRTRPPGASGPARSRPTRARPQRRRPRQGRRGTAPRSPLRPSGDACRPSISGCDARRSPPPAPRPHRSARGDDGDGEAARESRSGSPSPSYQRNNEAMCAVEQRGAAAVMPPQRRAGRAGAAKGGQETPAPCGLCCSSPLAFSTCWKLCFGVSASVFSPDP